MTEEEYEHRSVMAREAVDNALRSISTELWGPSEVVNDDDQSDFHPPYLLANYILISQWIGTDGDEIVISHRPSGTSASLAKGMAFTYLHDLD